MPYHHSHPQIHHHQFKEERESCEDASGMQEVIQMCSSFDATKSTKGASKLRRDLINAEIANLRDLLPLPSSTRQRLSQLQLMALVCVYVRKANYFQQVFKRNHELGHPFSTPNIGFSKSLSGFLIMMTQNGKLLYISDNAAEYLGHSMEDLLIHGDSVYDIIDKADHATVQTELLRNSGSGSSSSTPGEESRLFLCRMNVSRNARRQMRFGDQKVVLLQGRYLSYLPLCSRNEPVFVGSCTPVAMPETRECVVQGATNVFTSIHAMDMKFMHVDRNGEHYLGYSRQELGGISWYQLIHWNYMREAQSKHRLISQSEQEKSCILLLKMETRSGDWIWVHCVLQVKDGTDSNSGSTPHPTQSIIVATNQVLSDREASVMRANSWLYHYYTVQTKLQYGLAYPDAATAAAAAAAAAHHHQLQPSAAARLAAAAAYFPSAYSHHDPYHAHAHPHQMAQPGLTSPHTQGPVAPAQPSANGNGYPYMPPHPHYTHHQLDGAIKSKDSPLDFSLSSSGSTFDPYSPYWTHHHHTHHNPSQHSHQYHNHTSHSGSHYYGSSAGATTASSTTSHNHNHVKAESISPSGGNNNLSSWSLSISSSKPQIQISSSSINISPSSSSSSSGSSSSSPRKKKKVVAPLSSSPSLAERASLSEEVVHGQGQSSVLLASSTYHPHLRGRASYKMGIEALGTGRSEDLLSISSPLTPSPVWEGQTQRVPDLQPLSHQSHPLPDYHSAGNSEMIHCVPTYLPYGGTGGSGHSGTNASGFPYHHPYSYSFPLPHPHYLQLSGSPNKENRLPPTPESDSNENEENKPIKWESL